jgi:hypothetical protein
MTFRDHFIDGATYLLPTDLPAGAVVLRPTASSARPPAPVGSTSDPSP